MASELNPRQRQFIAEYLIDFNASQAAIRAGYSPKTGDRMAHELLKKPEIREAIQRGMHARQRRTEVTADRVVLELARVGFSDIRKTHDETGAQIPIHKLDDDTARAIASVKTTVKPDGETVQEIKLWPKNSALDTLAKHLGMLVDRKEISGPGGSPVEIAQQMTPEQIRAAIAQLDSEIGGGKGRLQE